MMGKSFMLYLYGNPNPWRYCTEVFDYLGIAAVIEGKIFCIHGGLSPQIKTLDQVAGAGSRAKSAVGVSLSLDDVN